MGASLKKRVRKAQKKRAQQASKISAVIPATDPNTDERLLERLKEGDAEALEFVMSKYHDKLKAVAAGICENPEDVEEVLQDVYMTLLRKADQFEGRSAFSTWLHRITVNHSLMKIRKQKRTRYQLSIDPYLALFALDTPDILPKRPNPEEILLDKELWESVHHAMQTLPEHHRRVFHLRDILGLSTRETSESLNLTDKTTKSRLRRSRIHVGRSISAIENLAH